MAKLKRNRTFGPQIAAVFADPSLAGWDGFGLAIQAYQKRAIEVIVWIDNLAALHNRRMMVRLVKGAYWDTEVKRAQERGLDDYPVFTRKAMTDLNYIAFAERMLKARPRIYPQFATHNALTVASILERAGGVEGFEFQRLHGMGDALYQHLLQNRDGLACRTYAPVGGHSDFARGLAHHHADDVRRFVKARATAPRAQTGALDPVVQTVAGLVLAARAGAVVDLAGVAHRCATAGLKAHGLSSASFVTALQRAGRRACNERR